MTIEACEKCPHSLAGDFLPMCGREQKENEIEQVWNPEELEKAVKKLPLGRVVARGEVVGVSGVYFVSGTAGRVCSTFFLQALPSGTLVGEEVVHEDVVRETLFWLYTKDMKGEPVWIPWVNFKKD